MLKCKVCGKEFEAEAEKHYIARDNVRSGLAVALAHDEEKLFDAFDCPHCGCQFVAQERKREYVVPNEVAANEEEEEEEEEEGTDYEKPSCFGNFEEEKDDGCEGCKYNEDCVREEYRRRMKPTKKPNCFGEFEEMDNECCNGCGYYKKCKEITFKKRHDEGVDKKEFCKGGK